VTLWAFLLKVGSEKGKQGVETNIQMLQGLLKFAEKTGNCKPATVNGINVAKAGKLNIGVYDVKGFPEIGK
jgi:hypothetical protein